MTGPRFALALAAALLATSLQGKGYFAGQEWDRFLRLPAHAPGNIRFARFIGGPVAAPQHTHAPNGQQRRGDQGDR